MADTAPAGAYAGDISATEAWSILAEEPAATLVDVRTQAEWAYVGLPDLSALGKQPLLVQWQAFPAMQVNPQFHLQLLQQIGEDRERPLVFLCRSGQRSAKAAAVMTQLGFARCYNIAPGFEGGLDDAKHRGTTSGWKVEGLPWLQG